MKPRRAISAVRRKVVRQPWKRWGLPAPKSEASTGRLSLVDYEVYSGIEVHDWPAFVRLDGWAFHTLTRKMKLRKPFDERLPQALAKSAETLFVPFNPVLCYIFSDEVNFLFPNPTLFTRVEKIDSVFSGLLSAHFSRLMKVSASFDCRVVPAGRRKILPYLIWRQAECWRNHNNAWAQWTIMRKAGLSPSRASRRLEGLSTRQLFDLCREYDVDLGETPVWQQRGVLLYRESYKKAGYNPLTKEHVVAERRRVKVDWAPPMFVSREGRTLLESLLSDRTDCSHF